MSSYESFIKSKHVRHEPSGFEPVKDMPSKLFDWQRKIVDWTCKKGRAAIFAECGLGKTPMQLAWCDQVAEYTGGDVLLLTPIAVGPQTIRESEKFGIQGVTLASSQDDIDGRNRIYVTNYDRLHKFDCQHFRGVCLDESSILKSFTGKIKRQLCDEFAETKYKLACTATAAPNDHMELGNHADFLSVMSREVMLARWFTHDSGDTSKWRLKKPGRKDFWRWVASWAVCVSQPSDVGGSDDGFILPGLQIHRHIIHDETPQPGQLFKTQSSAVAATDVHKVKRRTLQSRVEEAARLANGIDEPCTIWCDTDYEANELKKAIHFSVEVRGSTPAKVKEDYLNGFTEGRYQKLITKARIAGYGMNWQHCRHAIHFPTYSYEDAYQLIRRHYRFGQENTVHYHMVAADDELPVVEATERKSRQHLEMKNAMSDAMREGMQEELFGEQAVKRYQPSVPIQLPPFMQGGVYADAMS